MPNIPEYNPRNRALTPESKGQEATEIAGRRVGPLYNQAGEDVRERAKLTALGIRQRLWPFDIQALMEGRSGSGSGGGDSEGVSGFRVRGSGGSSSGGGGGSSLRDHSRAGRGASGFSGIANDLIGRGSPTSETIGDEGYSRYYQTLDHGDMITVDRRTGRVVSRPVPGPNAGAFEQAQKWYDYTYEQQKIYGPGAFTPDYEGQQDFGGGGEIEPRTGLRYSTQPAPEYGGGGTSWWGSMFDAGNAFSGYEGP